MPFDHVLTAHDLIFVNPLQATYVRLQTEGGASISGTPHHYVFAHRPTASTAASAPDFKNAAIATFSEVRTGDLIWVAQRLPPGGQSALLAQRVANVTEVFLPGMYSPKTLSGTILVDHVAALQFTAALPRVIWPFHVAMLPARFVSSLVPQTTLSWVFQLR